MLMKGSLSLAGGEEVAKLAPVKITAVRDLWITKMSGYVH